MNDRDHFAAAALPALITAAIETDLLGGNRDALAQEAYRLADAMLLVRGTQPKRRSKVAIGQSGLFAA